MSSKKSKQEATDMVQKAVDKAAADKKATNAQKLANARAMDAVRKKMGTD